MSGIIISSLAALSLVATGIYAVIKRKNAANIVLLVTALMLAGIEIFDRLSLQLSGEFDLFRGIALYLEALLPASFLTFSAIYRRNRPFATLSKVRLGFMAALALCPVIMHVISENNFAYSPDVQSEGVLFLNSGGYWYYIAILVSFVVALTNVEATL